MSPHTSGRGAPPREVAGPWGGAGRAVPGAVALLSLLALGPSACREPTPPTPPDAAAPVVKAIAPAPGARSPAPNPSPRRRAGEPVPPGLAKALHKTPLVGGCGPACANAEDAFTGFVAALAAADRHARVPRYLDTSRLVVDGADHGERLARMWLSGARSPRLQAIAALVDDLARGLTPADEGRLLELAHAAKLEVWPTRATVALDVHPDQAPWRLQVERRGREWLVVALDRR